MIRVITTPYGQLVADVNEEAGFTTIRDGKNFEVIAEVQTVDKNEVLKAIRRLGSVMKLREKLNKTGVKLQPGIKLVRSRTNDTSPPKQRSAW